MGALLFVIIVMGIALFLILFIMKRNFEEWKTEQEKGEKAVEKLREAVLTKMEEHICPFTDETEQQSNCITTKCVHFDTGKNANEVTFDGIGYPLDVNQLYEALPKCSLWNQPKDFGMKLEDFRENYG